MDKISLFSKIVLMTLVLSACGGGKTLYYWGDYSGALLSHYKDGTDPIILAEELQEIVFKAEDKDQVPPGLYAELGFAYLEADNTDQAVYYFAREKERWAESAQLMTEILQRLSQ